MIPPRTKSVGEASGAKLPAPGDSDVFALLIEEAVDAAREDGVGWSDIVSVLELRLYAAREELEAELDDGA